MGNIGPSVPTSLGLSNRTLSQALLPLVCPAYDFFHLASFLTEELQPSPLLAPTSQGAPRKSKGICAIAKYNFEVSILCHFLTITGLR